MESSGRSATQSIDRSARRSVGRLACRSSLSINRRARRSVCMSACRLVRRSVGGSVGLSVGRASADRWACHSACLLIGRSAYRPACRTLVCCLACQPIEWLRGWHPCMHVCRSVEATGMLGERAALHCTPLHAHCTPIARPIARPLHAYENTIESDICMIIKKGE